MNGKLYESCIFAADLVRGGRQVTREKGSPCGENPFNIK